MCSEPHKRTTLTTGENGNQKTETGPKTAVFLQNLPKPTDSKICETVTTLH